ncbi:MAG: TIGR00269 family protein [Aigarchaeota archaeon]|nr:TIGR00269 family protein [Aigarchaeota archaeon]MDW8021759.1 TIGR00269 family protein [Nitrososphaerota archaeon]
MIEQPVDPLQKASRCSTCRRNPPIYFRKYSGERLCAKCFRENITERVRKTISKYDLLRPDDRIMVAVSGGKDSLSLLRILHRIERDFPRAELYAVTVDEGVAGYREECLRIVRDFSSQLDIPFLSISFKELFGFTLEDAVECGAAEKIGIHPCTVCGVLRRKALVKAARKIGATVIATAHTLDDVVQTYLLNLLKGEGNIKPVGIRREGGSAIPRIAPFRLIPQREVALYAYLEKIPFQVKTCPYTHTSMRDKIREFLNWYSARYPESLYAFLSNFERMLNALLKTMSEGKCEICGEPSSRRMCRACEIELAIKRELGLDLEEPKGLERESDIRGEE